MAKERMSDFKLPSVDDLFKTDSDRFEENNTSGKILDIPISAIDEFENHPFKVLDNEEMEILINSIKEHGVIEPATVRRKDNGRYEMVSGHRRMHASKRLGLDTLRCEVVDITRDDAILQMVESNFHRETILPSEKAFSYKMRADVLNRQGKRSDLTLTPVVSKFNSLEEIGKVSGESREQVRRYIRLTNLIPELLDMVDNSVVKEKGKPQIALRPAVELSYLTHEEQELLLEAIEDNQCTPSHAQAIILKNMSQEGSLTEEVIFSIMCEEKPNQKKKPFLPEAIMNLLPAGMTEQSDIINHICKLLEGYNRKNNINSINQTTPIKGQAEITDYKEVLPKKKIKEDFER